MKPIVYEINRTHKLNAKQEFALKEVLANPLKRYIMLYGGSRSGKTHLALYYIRNRCYFYPGSRHLIARYSLANARKTIWRQSMLPLFRPDQRAGLCKINLSEGIIEYKNGAMIILGGLEPSRIDSVLAAEYGTIFVTEANENKWDDIENLFSRLNDTSKHRDSTRMMQSKFIIDLNPTVDRHWTNVLFRRGQDPITRKPRENFDKFAYVKFIPEDNIDNLRAGYIDELKNLSPAKRKRFYEGEFGAYEGLVFQLDEEVHIVDPFEIPAHWPRGRAIDFGYIHPFVTLWSALDEANETVYFYAEWSERRQTVAQHSKIIKNISIKDLPDATRKDAEAWKRAEKLYKFTMADHDAEDRATLEENGIVTEPAFKEVEAGLDQVIELFDHRPADGKKTKIKIFRSCTKLIDGLFSYRWADPDNQNSKKDRAVLKENDDEADALRYCVLAWFPIQDTTAGMAASKSQRQRIDEKNPIPKATPPVGEELPPPSLKGKTGQQILNQRLGRLHRPKQ